MVTVRSVVRSVVKGRCRIAAPTLETEKPEISLFIRHNDYPSRSECLARSGE